MARDVCMHVGILSSTAVRAKADYGMELTLVGENSFTGAARGRGRKILKRGDLVSTAQRRSTVDP